MIESSLGYSPTKNINAYPSNDGAQSNSHTEIKPTMTCKQKIVGVLAEFVRVCVGGVCGEGVLCL